MISHPHADSSERCAVIIGASHGGVATAAALRDMQYPGRIILVGSEPHLPYERPPLSKAFLKGTIGNDGIALRAASWYADHDVELLGGTRVDAINLIERTVATNSGTLAWTELILATGTRARKMSVDGADLGGVHTVRTVDDARALQPALAERGEFVVIGAGFIGLEFAAVASDQGHRVTVVEAAPAALTRAVSRPVADHLVQSLADAGVQFRFGAAVERLAAQLGQPDRVGGVVLGDGETLRADRVVVGIGADVDTELALRAGLITDQFGVSVDEYLRTSDPQVFAVGDCASFVPHGRNQRTRLESVQNATDHARTAAAAITGSPTPYIAVPWFWSDQSTRRLQIAGLAAPTDSAVTLGDVSSGRFSVLRYDADRLTAVESINRPADHLAARTLLKQGRSPDPDDLARPDFTLKSFTAATGSEPVLAASTA